MATDTDNRFVGYKALDNRAGSQPTSLACLSSETRSYIVTSGRTIGNCCPTSATCDFPTTCLGGTLFYPPPDGATTGAGKQRVCGTSSACNSFTVLPLSNGASNQPSTIDYFCYQTQTTWPYPTLYLTDPALQANISPTRQTATSSSVPHTQPSGSKAWIAGAVIGPLVLLGAVGAGVLFLFLRRKKKRTHAAQQQQQQHQPDIPYPADKSEIDSSGIAQPPLGAPRNVYEMPGSGPQLGYAPAAGGTALGAAHEKDAMAPRLPHEMHGAMQAPAMAELSGNRPPAELTGVARPAEMSAGRPPAELTGGERPAELSGVRPPVEMGGGERPAELGTYMPGGGEGYDRGYAPPGR